MSTANLPHLLPVMKIVHIMRIHSRGSVEYLGRGLVGKILSLNIPE